MTFLYHRIKSYLSYWLNAVGEHSLQAPFIYDLYKKVIGQKVNNECNDILEAINALKENKSTVQLEGFGAGSSYLNNNQRIISAIAKNGIVKHKFGILLNRLINYTESKNILELGTSLGVSTLYLSENPNMKVTTVEGEPALAKIAATVFDDFKRDNITLINAAADEALPNYLKEIQPLDFVFFDANHTKEATLRYFNLCLNKKHDKSCFVFDDIHWSPDMESAWDLICQHYEVTLSIDLYQMGIVFFNPEIRKQHFVLEF